MKKKSIILFFVVCIALMTTMVAYCALRCGEDINVTEGLEKYNTAYTYMVKNEDRNTYSLYIYSSPVQNRVKNVCTRIDNNIYKYSGNMDIFAYESRNSSIKCFFPKNLSNNIYISDGWNEYAFFIGNNNATSCTLKNDYINIYGDKKSALIYEIDNDYKVVTYPINTGIHIEILFDEKSEMRDEYLPTLYFDKKYYIDRETEDYCLLTNNMGANLVINSPIIDCGNNKLEFGFKWNYLKKSSYGYMINNSILSSNRIIKRIAYDIQIQCDSMPDTTIYENYAKNVYLSNYAAVGKSSNRGEGWHYQRYRINYFIRTNKNNIVSANYCIRNLDWKYNSPILTMYIPNETWSSTQMTWKQRIGYYEKNLVSISESDKVGWYKFDITNLVKEMVEDPTYLKESIGSILNAGDDYALLATSDNGDNIPYIEIEFFQLPEEFYAKRSINEGE